MFVLVRPVLSVFEQYQFLVLLTLLNGYVAFLDHRHIVLGAVVIGKRLSSFQMACHPKAPRPHSGQPHSNVLPDLSNELFLIAA